ncbi:MAG: transcriptional repressor [Oscillospiraceae bacterium]|nr:transcriptional repressor [Oscillospiraceae bacterium]
MSDNSYKTKQRDEIVEFFNSHRGKCYTAKDLIKSGEVSSGEATVYRTLSKLAGQGILKRFTDGDAACYQLNESEECSRHFHLKCESCGKVIHMDCDFMADMSRHIEQGHSFFVDIGKTVIYGLCGECKERENA